MVIWFFFSFPSWLSKIVTGLFLKAICFLSSLTFSLIQITFLSETFVECCFRVTISSDFLCFFFIHLIHHKLYQWKFIHWFCFLLLLIPKWQFSIGFFLQRDSIWYICRFLVYFLLSTFFVVFHYLLLSKSYKSFGMFFFFFFFSSKWLNSS